jgi:hypothetical protein
MLWKSATAEILLRHGIDFWQIITIIPSYRLFLIFLIYNRLESDIYAPFLRTYKIKYHCQPPRPYRGAFGFSVPGVQDWIDGFVGFLKPWFLSTDKEMEV